MSFERIAVTVWGGISGVAFGVIVIFAQLQSSYYSTLLTVTGLAGAIGANTAYSISNSKPSARKRRLTKSGDFSEYQVERVIGKIAERYALSPYQEYILVALNEFHQELEELKNESRI